MAYGYGFQPPISRSGIRWNVRIPTQLVGSGVANQIRKAAQMFILKVSYRARRGIAQKIIRAFGRSREGDFLGHREFPLGGAV